MLAFDVGEVENSGNYLMQVGLTLVAVGMVPGMYGPRQLLACSFDSISPCVEVHMQGVGGLDNRERMMDGEAVVRFSMGFLLKRGLQIGTYG